MITAGVQQALQTLETGGSPGGGSPTGSLHETTVTGEAFRQAFTAKVGGERSDSGGGVATGVKIKGPASSGEQSRSLAGENGTLHSHTFLISRPGAPSVSAMSLLSKASSDRKTHSPDAFAPKTTAAGDLDVAAESGTTGFRAEAHLLKEAVSSTGLGEAGVSRQTAVAKDASAAASLSGNSAAGESAPVRVTRNLPNVAKTIYSRGTDEEAGVLGIKHDVASSTHSLALAPAEAQLSVTSTLIASSTSAPEGTGPLGTYTAPSVPGGGRIVIAAESTAAVRRENVARSKVDDGEAVSISVSAADALPGVNRGNSAIEDARNASASTTSLASVSRATSTTTSAGAGSEALDTFGVQPGTQVQLSAAVSERLRLSAAIPSVGRSSGPIPGVEKAPEVLSTSSLRSLADDNVSGTTANPPDFASRTPTRTPAITASLAGAGSEPKATHPPAGVVPAAGISAKKMIAEDGWAGSSAKTESEKIEGPATFLEGSTRSLQPSQASSGLQRPAEGSGIATAASQTSNAATRERTAKGAAGKASAENNDPAIPAAQWASDKDNSTVMPASVVSPLKDVALSTTPIGGSLLTAISAHTGPALLSGPAGHAAQLSGPAVAGGSAGRAEGKLDAVVNPQGAVTSSGAESHRTLVATPTALEVGLQTGTEGWLKIRAETSGQGEVKASLDAVSAAGRELLHTQLPALNAFLHSEQMPVTASVAQRSAASDVNTAGAAVVSSGSSGSSHGALSQQGGDPQASERHVNFVSGEALGREVSETPENYDTPGLVSGSIGLSAGPAGTPGENGRWLNVRV